VGHKKNTRMPEVQGKQIETFGFKLMGKDHSSI
jgi:hypothetical protein